MTLRNRKLNRWKNFDYSENGWYFVTICAGARIQSLCHWDNGHIVLNENGKIVEKQWKWVGEHFDGVEIDEHIIMPNHVHAIVIINNNVGTGLVNMAGTGSVNMAGTGLINKVGTGLINKVGTGRDLSLRKKQKTLSQIVGAFKTTSSKLIHQNGYTHFCWQRSFHDRIIRSEKELMAIRWYLKNNPKNWENDRNNI